MGTAPHCPRCGREVPPDSAFCPGCGFDLHDARPRLATGMLPSNQLIHRRYVIARRLAQGGQSAVYLVGDMVEGGQRALKEMSDANLSPVERESAINDFIREAHMLSTLDHPALARVYENFVEGQKQYLVMEYVQGHNLEDEMIEAGRPLDWPRVVGWGIALCDVLTYLHGQQPPIIYRDLKPANVMLTTDGHLKLIDFGIARRLHANRSRDTAQLGTDGYAPIEQYSARSEPRSDLYALGASLYHLLTGRVPESAPARIGGQSLTPLRAISPQVPEPIEHAIHRALSLQARERYDDARHMGDALAQAAREARGGTGSDEITALPLVIANHGGGQLTGHTETNLPSLTVAPQAIDPSVSQLEVRIDTAGLRPGPYTCHLAVRTSGGDQIVPVRFHVRPAR